MEEYKRFGFEISLSPIYEGLNDEVLKIHINEIYTDLIILKPDNKKEVALNSYRDLFWSHNKRNRTIFVKGEAGVGKSTWCIQLLYAWTKTHGRSDDNSVNDTNKLPNIATKDMGDALSPFDLLIFIPLRYINGKKSIKDIIFSSHLERLSMFKAVFRYILDTCSEKVLILLDGLDECTDNLCYDGLNQCTVISTTRPWKYDIACTQFPGLKIDLTLKLKGLNEVGVKQLTEKVCMTLAEKKDSQTFISGAQKQTIQFQVDDFLKKIRAVGLFDYVHIPLILIIMAECYLINKSLSSSLTRNMTELLEILLERGEEKLSETDGKTLTVLKMKWSNKEHVSLFADNDILSDYSHIFEQLSFLAYQGLLGSEREKSLVFDEKQLNQYFSQEELYFCCRYGLLSKSKHFTSLLRKPKVCISFYHKLVQEFFAAVFITSNKEAFDLLKKCLDCMRNVLEMENVILFVCGLNPHVGSRLTKHFVDICNRDERIFDSRCYWNMGVFFPGLYRFSKLILRCQEEVNQSSEPFEPLYISDILIPSHICLLDPVMKLLNNSVTCLKALHLLSAEMPYLNLCQLLDVISKAVSLKTVAIEILPLKDQNENMFHNLSIDLSRHCNLETISARDKVQCIPSPLMPLLRSIGSCPSLLNLQLWNVGPNCCDLLLTVIPGLENLEHLLLVSATFTQGVLTLENSNLKTLYLRNISFNNGYVELKTVYQLEEIYIKHVQMSTIGWMKLFDNVQKNLKTLELEAIQCENCEINLENSSKLESLEICDLSVSEIRLGKGAQLKELVICRVVMPHVSWCSLFASLRSENLQQVRLANLDIGESDFTLECSSQLQTLSISNLKTSNNSYVTDFQKTKQVYNIWEKFFGSLPYKNLQDLGLYNFDVGNAKLRLADCVCLRLLKIGGVKMSHESHGSLICNLSRLSSLLVSDIDDLSVDGILYNYFGSGPGLQRIVHSRKGITHGNDVT